MRTGRIIAVSPDGAFRRELDAALRAVTDAVEVHAALHALGAGGPPAALCVIHLEGELARTSAELLGPLTGGCPVIAVLPRSDVTAAVALMQASSNVAAVMVAERFDPRQLSAVAARIVADDVFGLAQVMAPETQLHTQLVGDHREKALCMAAVAELVAQAGVPRRHREPIEQCLDEMLMNALYDAPVDEQGQHIFAGVPTNVRVTLRTEHRVAVQYACDGTRFAVAVRDAFGSLERRIVLRHLHKGLHAEQKIDRKAGGAGLGLYLMTHAATAVSFHVLPGISTEALCVFELEAPRRQLEQLAFLVQRDAAGQVPSGPARRLPAGPRRRGRVVAAALAALA
ncbi:MAG TPA: ATP-binding protein, partial [Kofleriaceae bacterium]|nr:ATP-binding protein [Kofleriaceae bacterium]